MNAELRAQYRVSVPIPYLFTVVTFVPAAGVLKYVPYKLVKVTVLDAATVWTPNLLI